MICSSRPDTQALARSAGDRVSQARLWDRHFEMAKIGATGNGGVNRQALTVAEVDARLLLLQWTTAAGLSASMDAIGNMFFRREGEDSALPPVMTGSHLDTEPTGGRFDGVYGVLAGLEAIDALNIAGVRTKRPIELAVWTNEEGCRFEPGCMGSLAYCRPSRLTELLAARDADGIRVMDELAVMRERLPPLPEHAIGAAPSAFVEVHIEQGPILEELGASVGVVTGIQGMRRHLVTVDGEPAHGGTTPRAARKDALLAAVDMIRELRRIADACEDSLRFTVGRLSVSPNSPSVVPSNVTFTVDLRHGNAKLLEQLDAKVKVTCAELAGPCAVSVQEVSINPPTMFADSIQSLIRGAAQRRTIAHATLPSGAAHDARHLAEIAPTGMIFVPCLRGISHNEAESAEPADLAAGTQVLTEVLVELACA
jgi:beta-ureidopropionase / N-carbamoyl-L-amino-acid hydrolase